MRNRLLLALMLSTASLASPVHADQPTFRLNLKAPIYFSEVTPGPVEPETPESITMSLQTNDFAARSVGDAFEFDFKTLLTMSGGDIADVDWALGTPNDLPIAFSSTGVASGALNAAGEYDFQVVASHPAAATPAQQVYTIVVNGISLKVTSLAAGEGHTCALSTDSTVWCWGNGGSGQLGNDGTASSGKPVQVVDSSGTGLLSDVIGISAGSHHTCAINTEGAWCWGNGGFGQLGNATTASSNRPVQVVGQDGTGLLSSLVEISAGGYHSCAHNGNKAWCWGRNNDGQLGNYSNVNRSYPVEVIHGSSNPLVGVTDISAGSSHSCAVNAAGAWCWGNGGVGRLGDGNAISSNRPLATVVGPPGVSKLAGVTKISAGGSHTCAIASSSLWCWGAGADGQLGTNTSGYNYRPAQVLSSAGAGYLSSSTDVSAAANHTCAIASGQAWCWGAGADGRLGNGGTTTIRRPVSVSGTNGAVALTGATSIAAGTAHACAVTAEGTSCWGSGLQGRLGNDATTGSNVPVQVVTP